MTVTFCGHGDIYYDEIMTKKLYDITEQLINSGAHEFLIGGYGNFDILAARTVNRLKRKYPYIKSVMVLPYLNRKYDLQMYDTTIYPPLERVPLKYAISKRNEWMIMHSDVVVAYVKHDWGGAAKTLSCAIQHQKQTINIYDDFDL